MNSWNSNISVVSFLLDFHVFSHQFGHADSARDIHVRVEYHLRDEYLNFYEVKSVKSLILKVNFWLFFSNFSFFYKSFKIFYCDSRNLRIANTQENSFVHKNQGFWKKIHNFEISTDETDRRPPRPPSENLLRAFSFNELYLSEQSRLQSIGSEL